MADERLPGAETRSYSLKAVAIIRQAHWNYPRWDYLTYKDDGSFYAHGSWLVKPPLSSPNIYSSNQACNRHLEKRNQDFGWSSYLVDTFAFRKRDQARGLDFYRLQTEAGFIRFHYPDFLQVLVDHLPALCSVSVSRRLRGYIQNSLDKVNRLFEDGAAAECDILIGADGVKSTVHRNGLTNKARKAAEAGN
ncbi:hypothetical protein BD779DRAFT_1476578 [Infundibulicybe gibba]|nr:hypothetical protein BD779DRAFT_1476578 [Infundibulicybe gibba]